MRTATRLVIGLLLPVVATAQNPSSPPAAPISKAELFRRLDQHVDSLATAGGFSGLVVLAKDGAPVWQRAVGLADRVAHRAPTLETAFNVGSINKLFTGIAIRQLAAKGRLHLDSTLAAYWPDYPNADVARRVTIRQLLSHRSGIGGNIFAAPKGGSRGDIRHNRDYLPLFVHRPLDFEPGSRQAYSNAGYIVLGALVERLSGEDYYDYVRRHIYEPAHMKATAHYRADSLPAHAAVGYLEDGQPNTATLPGRGSAAGGGYSTAGDLIRLLTALRAKAIVAGPPAGIGMAGGAPGLNAVVEGDLPGGFDVIVLANQSPPAAERVARTVRGWLGAEN